MNMEKYQQKTIKHEISCVGVGLHTGEKITMVMKPADIDTGIVFHRTDKDGHDAYIPARHENVVDTRMCTCVGTPDGVRVATIEHLMAAIHASGLSNLEIDVNGPETPVMDGSSAAFMFLLECAGVKVQNAPQKAIHVLKPVSVQNDGKEVSLLPAGKGLSMHFAIDFPVPVIGHQEVSLELTRANFKNMFCRARTFGFLKDIEALRSIGLARGGSLDNAILVDGEKIVNKDGLRYKDEFVRHKMLDAVGDLYMTGMPLIAKFSGVRSGHADTHALLGALLSDESAFEIVDLPSYMTLSEQNKALENDDDAAFLCA